MNNTIIDYLLIGHFAADVTTSVPGGFTLGGTVAYAAATAQAFGLRVGIVTSAAPDEPLLAHLRRYAEVVVIPAAQTTTFDNQYTATGRVQHCTALAAPLNAEHIPPAWLHTPLVHIAPLMDEIAPGLIHQLPPGCNVLITPQGWLRQRHADQRVSFKHWADANTLKRANMVILSEEDIAAAPELATTYATMTDQLVITRGDKGGTLYTTTQPAPYPAIPTNAIDHTGAGDVFAASAFIAWHHHQRSLPLAVRVAAQLAAQAVTRNGLASAPTTNEVQAALATYP